MQFQKAKRPKGQPPRGAHARSDHTGAELVSANGAGRRIWPIGKAFRVDASWKDRFKRMEHARQSKDAAASLPPPLLFCQGWKPHGQDREPGLVHDSPPGQSPNGLAKRRITAENGWILRKSRVNCESDLRPRRLRRFQLVVFIECIITVELKTKQR